MNGNEWLELLELRLRACVESLRWIESLPDDTPEELWRTCPRGDWLLWLATELQIRRQALVLAACACARLALPIVSVPEEREEATRALETAEKWTRGEATQDEVQTAADAVNSLYYASGDESDDAAAFAAIQAAVEAPFDADSVWCAAGDIADVADNITEILRQCADLVRERISWEVVLAAASARSRLSRLSRLYAEGE